MRKFPDLIPHRLSAQPFQNDITAGLRQYPFETKPVMIIIFNIGKRKTDAAYDVLWQVWRSQRAGVCVRSTLRPEEQHHNHSNI